MDRDRMVLPAAVRARRAVGVVFALNGFAFASLVPRLPGLKRDLGLSNTSFGTAVAAVPVGALLAGACAGMVIQRVGSRRLAGGATVALAATLPLFAVVPAWWALTTGFLLFGAVDSVMDVAMNAHSLRVQRAHDRSIVSALHGLWSVGAVAGSLVGAATIGLGIPIGVHLTAAGALVVGANAVVGPRLLAGPDPEPDPDPDPFPDPGPGSRIPGRNRGTVVARPVRLAGGRRLAVLGLVVLLAAMVEDAAASWSAVFLRNELATTAAVASLGFVAFQVAMTAGRLLGDRLIDRFGGRAVVRASALVVAVGMGAGLLADTGPSVIAGFALAGLGSAPLFPLVFRASGDVPGVSPGHGVATVALLSRVGFLVSAPAVGLLGDAFDLRAALLVVPVAALLIAGVSGVIAPRAAIAPDRRGEVGPGRRGGILPG